MLLLLSLVGWVHASGVVINEAVIGPEGSDSELNWVELYNTSDVAVDLGGWSLEWGSTDATYSGVHTFDSVEITAGGYLLVGGTGVTVADVTTALTFGSGETDSDAIRLIGSTDGSDFTDTLIYGSPNTDAWLDEDGVVAESLAPSPVVGGSLGRAVDGVDSDASGDDFVVFAVPTPGESNVSAVTDSGEPDDSGSVDTGAHVDTGSATLCHVSETLKINEVQITPALPSEDGRQWLELYNAGTISLNLGGWRVQAGSEPEGIETIVEFPMDTEIAAGDFLVIGDSGAPSPDVSAPMSLGDAESNADMIQLVDCEDAIVDTLIYGSPNADEWVDDWGEVATSTAPVSAAGESIARSPDGMDSDDAGVDFVVVAVPTPGGPFMVVDDGCAPSTDIKINEVLANPDGADGGNEWIELYNAGTAEVRLADWKIQGGTRPSSLSEDYVFDADTVLGPGEFLVIGESGVASADVWADALSLGNAGENADIVQLVNCDGDVADTLVYGSPNDDEWVDDSGALATSLGPVAPSGQTIARRVDGLDSDAAGEDFGSAVIPTPGDTNEVSDEGDDDGDDDGGTDLDGDDDGGTDDDGGPVDVSDCPGATSIKLNEVLVDPEGSDGGNEWIELYNAGTASVNLDDWSLEGGTSDVSTYVAFEGGINLAPGEYLLVGDTEVAGADVVTSINMGNAGSNADIVRLVDCSDVVVDTLVYGSPNEDEWLDDSGSVATSLAPKAASGMTLARRADGYDTDACADDWVVSMDPTPGSENPSLDPIECSEGSRQIKINEFMVDPDSSLVGEEVEDSDLEWVELYNNSSESVSIDGWRLQWGKSGSYSGSVVFEAGTTVESGSWMLIGGSLVSDADVVTSFDLGNAGSNADALQLVDCADLVQDTVIYGPNNDDGWLDDEDEVASSLAESPGKEKSSARIADGEDTEQSGVDFVVSDSPTPGASNVGISVTDCVPGEQDIKINEILPDPEGADDGFEFIELYNTSSDELSIEGWAIATGTSSWPSDAGFSFPAGARIPAGGFVVVAQSEVADADFYTDEEQKFALGNGSSAPDGVRLEDCTGAVQDTVLYGDPADPIEDLELEDDQGLSSMATMPESNMSVGRSDDGVDTDDNAADFTTNMPPTPGESNAARDLAGGSGKGCGCGGKSEEPDGTDGPMEAGGLAGLMASLIVFVLMRRRD